MEVPLTNEASLGEGGPRSMDFNEEDIIIPVMGVTGSGKSTFIQLLTGHNLEIGHGLESATAQIEVVSFAYKGQRVFLVDTPGFDDTNRSDTDVLRDIAFWLSATYTSKARLTGIVYLHRISDPRMQGSAVRNLRMFQKLCGEQSMSSVILVTTHWNKVSDREGHAREKEIVQTNEFWGGMVRRGSKVWRYDNTEASALEIVAYLISKGTRVVLDIQRQMVDNAMSLEDTAAGQAVQQDLFEMRERHVKELQDLKQEMDEAIRDRDVRFQEIIDYDRGRLEGEILRLNQERSALKVDLWRLRTEREGEAQRKKIKVLQAEEEQEHRQRMERLEKEYLLSHKKVDTLATESAQAKKELQQAHEAIAKEKKAHEESTKRLQNRILELSDKPQSKAAHESARMQKGHNQELDIPMTDMPGPAVDYTAELQANIAPTEKSESPRRRAAASGVDKARSSVSVNKEVLISEDPGPENHDAMSDANARGESDSGYGPSLRDNVQYGGQLSTNASVLDPGVPREDSISRFSGRGVHQGSGRKLAGPQHPLEPDDEIRSVISDKDEIYSQSSAKRTAEGVTAEQHLGRLLAEHDKLKPLYIEALARMGDDRFVDNFRRLLKRFYLDLLRDAKTNLERATVHLLRYRWSRIRIARQVVDVLQPRSEEENVGPRLGVEDLDDKLLRLESWVTSNAGFAASSEELETEATRGGSDVDNDLSSGDDSTGDELQNLSRLPKISGMEDFFLGGNPFEALLVNLRLFLLPKTLVPFTRIILSISSEHIWFSPEEDNSLSNQIKSFVEDHTEDRWNWWPLRPRMKKLRKDQTRMHWICHCNTRLWAEMPKFQAETFQVLLRQRGPVQQEGHLCKKRQNRNSKTTVSGAKTQAVGSLPQSQSSGRATGGTSILKTQAKQHTKATRPSQEDGASNRVPGTVTTDQPGTPVSISMAPESFILFGVDGGRKTLELAQVDTKEQKHDGAFFDALRLNYQKCRGIWRYWFSVWRFSHCDFIKFEKIRKNRIIHRGQDLPTDPDYEYTPRPPDAAIPPISPHEFELAFSSCNSRCIFSRLPLLHDCETPPTGTIAMQRIPKRKRALELELDFREFAWGLYAQHVISILGVVFYHVLILTTTFIFWGWWLARHPDDLQNASVPLTVVAVLISLFWSSAGILRNRREVT